MPDGPPALGRGRRHGPRLGRLGRRVHEARSGRLSVPIAGLLEAATRGSLAAATQTAGRYGVASEPHALQLDSTLGLLCVVGFDGYIKRWNPAWGQTFGFSPEEIMSIPAGALVHADDIRG